MLRKCAAVLAVSLLCLSGQANAQQATSKATISSKAATSTVQRVGAKSGQANNAFGLTTPQMVGFFIFGIGTTAIIVNRNNNKSTPVSK